MRVDLNPVFTIAIHLDQLHNIDLIQRGYYQVAFHDLFVLQLSSTNHISQFFGGGGKGWGEISEVVSLL